MTAEASFMARNIHSPFLLASPNFHIVHESITYTPRDIDRMPRHNSRMENKVPGQYDPHEAYKRFRAELLRAHQIDLLRYGDVKRAADLLGVSQQSVSNWKQRGLPTSIMLKIDTQTDMDAEYIYQLGEAKRVKRGLEKPEDAQSELVKQIAELLQRLTRKRRR